jgi:polysaccharide export outer membrane protein
VRQLQQKQLDEMVERLEKELLGRGGAEISTALSPEETRIKESEIRQKREFIKGLKNIKVIGRMVLKIDVPEQLKNTPYDIELEEGDSLFIPADPHSVQVIGSVYNQTAFVYDKDLSISKYIDLAGGYTENADKKRVYVLKVDGTAVRPQSGIVWSKDSNRWEIGNRELDPGDTVVVPEKLEKIAWMRDFKDITQILYQIAVTAGVLIVAF